MQVNLTVKDAVRFILEEPRVLKGWHVKDIFRTIYKAIADETLFWTRKDGQLCGLVVGYYQRDSNLFHVCALKSTQRGLLRIYFREFRRRFPGVRLTAYRHGEFIEYER